MKTISNNLIASLSLLLSSCLLLGAFFLEIYLSLIPCDLCIKQRVVHLTILILSLFILPLYTFSNLKFCIEKKLWKGFSECSSNLTFNENTLDQLLSRSPIRCDETQFELLNISLAGWNGILSIIIFIILSYLLYKSYKETR